MKKTDIILLHYGDIQDTKQCIQSIEKSVRLYRSIIVVNNDSAIDIHKQLEKKPKRTYINSGKNVGFAAGVNIGIKYALDNGAEYIVLVNNDTVASSDFITPIHTFLEKNKKIGIAAPVIQFKKDNTTYFDLGGNIQKYTGKTYHTNVKKHSGKQPYRTAYVSGCCMIIRREVLERVGLFDPKFFLYYEDVDFCLRAREHGFEIYVVPPASITHSLSKTVGGNSDLAVYHLIKSAKRFGKKYRKMFPLHWLFMFWQSGIFFIKSPSKTRTIINGWM